MKNLPQRERSGRRSASSYKRKGEHPSVYSDWSPAYQQEITNSCLAHHRSLYGAGHFCALSPNYAYRYEQAV